jgi:hypothetical protein
MAGPWEKYSAPDSDSSAQDTSGPWSKYAQAPGFFDGAAKSAIDSLPMVGGAVGAAIGTPADALTGPLGTAGGAAIGGYLGTAAKNLINKYYDPASAPQTTTDALVQPVVSGANQGMAALTGEAVAPYIASGVQSVAGAFKSAGAAKAITATGATGAQAAKFSPDAGQALLDQGIVKFGDSQAAVAQKATDALDKSGQKIGDLLTNLDKKGATVDQGDIIDAMRARATQLSKNPAQFNVADSLNRTADRLQAMVEASGGDSKIPLSEAEGTKRDFQLSANYNSSPADLSHAKEAAGIYRQAVEDAATKFDPNAGQAFADEKKAYALLRPVQEAAGKRALTVAQSPPGGLLDTAAEIAGEGVAGIPGMIAAPIIRRSVATRIAPTMAATYNAAGNLLGGVPAMAGAAAPAALQAPASAIPSAINSGARTLMAVPAAAQNNSAPNPSATVVQGPGTNRSPAGPGRSPSSVSSSSGPDSWAQQGVQKLGINDGVLIDRLKQDPKGKQFLIQASDLAPGSKAMKTLQNQISQYQIQKGWGQS